MSKILIVDDEEEARSVLREILKREGYEVFQAANGEEAIRIVKDNRPDVILLDIRMPVMDGFEVCKRLKEKEETKAIPIITITGYSEEKEKSLMSGADDFLSKPFEKIDLITRIKAILRIGQLKDELERTKAYLEELGKEGKI